MGISPGPVRAHVESEPGPPVLSRTACYTVQSGIISAPVHASGRPLGGPAEGMSLDENVIERWHPVQISRDTTE